MTIVNMTQIQTPLGLMLACATERGICMLEFADKEERFQKRLQTELMQVTKAFTAPVKSDNPLFKPLQEQLSAYFGKELKQFDLPLELVGTEFQKKVWNTLLQIPYGEVISYAKEAQQMGSVQAVRAVANANGMNKISIIIPCHRVIGSNGTLTGYGGGLWRKEKLLALEGRSFSKTAEDATINYELF